MIMACHAPQLSLFHNSQAIALPVQQNSVYQRQRLVKFSCQTIIATQPSLNPRVVRHRKLCISCCVPSHSSSDRPTPLDHKVDLSADKGAADARSPPIRPHPQAVPPAAPPDGPPGAAAPVPFYKHLLKQLYIATGALLVLFFLFNSFSRCLQIAKPFITDSPPAAVWLPRPQSLQQPATTQQHWLAAAKFASSSITATSRQIMRIPDSFYVQCTATLQQVLLANVLVKIGAVFTVALPLVWLGGLLYHCTSGESLQISLFKVYAVLYRAPGAKVTEETTLPAALLMNLIFLCGLFTFAVVLGFVSEEIKSQLRAVKAGNYRVMTSEHTLILNWSPQLVPLLKQMSLARTHQIKALMHDKPIVILAERDKLEMDAELRDILAECKLKVITREGAPHYVRDLSGVAAGQARTIVILNPEDAVDPTRSKTATVLAIQQLRHGHPSMLYPDQNIVLQTSEDETVAAIPGENPLADLMHQHKNSDWKPIRVNGARDITRLMAQSAVQPGVANVYCAVTQHSRNGATFYLESFPSLTGRPYKEVRRSFHQGVVCGYVSKTDHCVHLNPGEDNVLAWGDRLVILANDDSFQPGEGHEAASRWMGGPHDGVGPEYMAELSRNAPKSGSNHKNIVVVGWGPHFEDLASGLAEFAVDGTVVSVINPERPRGLPEQPLRGIQFNHIEGSATSFNSFRQADLADCDSILLGGLTNMPGKEGDAHMLSTLMQVKDYLHKHRKRSKPAHLVTTHTHAATMDVANYIIGEKDVLTAELVHPEELMSGLLSQVAAEPDMAPLLTELVDNSDGQEIYLRRPERYGLANDISTTFAEVAELVRLQGETAIGYIAGGDAVMHLAPGSQDKHIFDEHARVVVIASE